MARGLALSIVLAVTAATAFSSPLDITPIQWLARRTLLGPTPQCDCLKSEFKCKYSSLNCPAGMAMSGQQVLDALQCSPSVGITDLNPACPPPVVDTNDTVVCGGHVEIDTIKLCLPGTPVNGASSSCESCQSLTTSGNCGLLGPWGYNMNNISDHPTPDSLRDDNAMRTTLTGCTTSVACTSLGQVIDVNDLNCIKYNRVDPTGGPLFWYDALDINTDYYRKIYGYDINSSPNCHNNCQAVVSELPTLINCNEYLMANACIYKISAAPSNKCLNKASGTISVTIGKLDDNTPETYKATKAPITCPHPTEPDTNI